MDHICMTIPVTAGKSAAARAFMRELDGARRGEYDASERRIGITKEVWFLSASAAGDQLVGYMEATDFGRALSAFVGSRDPFDMWFKEQMHAVTGVDLNNPPADMAPAELLSTYIAQAAAPV
jgi:hypothetical protein